MPKRTAKSPANGGNTTKKTNMEGNVLTQDMFQKLLDGQNKIAEDLRVNLDKQREYERNAEVSKRGNCERKPTFHQRKSWSKSRNHGDAT